MARLRPRRIAYCAILYLTLTAAASGQGALYKLFRAGYYLSKTTDSALTYNINKVTTKAWLDSLYSGGADTLTFNQVTQPGLADGDSARFNFINTAGWESEYGYRNQAVAMATQRWKVVRVGVTHSQTIGVLYLSRDTLVYNDTNSVVIPAGSLLYVSWVGATTYTTRAGQHPRATEQAQQVRIYYDPRPGYGSGGGAYVPAFEPVQVPLIIANGIGQTGLQDDAEITVTVSVVRL